MRIHIEKLAKRISEYDVEIVERKCSGHPDTICDEICEAFSRELSKAYLKKFGKVLHHNVDKALLVAGKSTPRFGGGTVDTPIRIIISGRATAGIDVEKIGLDAAKAYLDKIGVGSRHFKIIIDVKEGAGNLKEVFEKQEIVANDTSFGVGYAPYSVLETTVLDVASLIESANFSRNFPFVGKDVKVMGLRIGNEIKIIIASAFIGRHIENIGDYFRKKQKFLEFLQKKFSKVNFKINTLDNVNSSDESGVYLTVLGLSAEMGDDGQVGRGNRVNGMITPNRPMTLEAACGKNPTTHTGKIYSVMANIIASEIYKKVAGIKEVNVKILSSIGKPINQPQVITIEVAGELGDAMREKISRIAGSWLSQPDKVSKIIIGQKVRLC